MEFREISRAGDDLIIREAGGGPTVWYIHDEVSAEPGAVAADLAARFHVLAPVIPGFAGAGRPDWVETTQDVADLYLEPVRRHQQSNEDLVLIGSSMGAWVAVEVALALFDLEPRLALAGPLGLYLPGHPPADHWFMTDEDRDVTLYHDPSRKPSVPAEEFIANESMAARMGWNPRFASPRLAPRLNRLRFPAMVVWGANDRLLPAAHREQWARLLPQSATVVLDGCGHYPAYERPHEMAAALTEFVEQHTRTAEGVSS